MAIELRDGLTQAERLTSVRKRAGISTQVLTDPQLIITIEQSDSIIQVRWPGNKIPTTLKEQFIAASDLQAASLILIQSRKQEAREMARLYLKIIDSIIDSVGDQADGTGSQIITTYGIKTDYNRMGSFQ